MQGKLWGTVSPANPHLTYCKRDPCFKACCTHRCSTLRCDTGPDERTPVPLSHTIVKVSFDSSFAGAGIG